MDRARSGRRWNDAVYAVVRRIPKGRVATYGQIAQLLGRPRGGREVGWALHGCDDSSVPCHRVVDRSGRLAPHFGGVGPVAQRHSLEREGVRFRTEHVDLERYLWDEVPAQGPVPRGGRADRSI